MKHDLKIKPEDFWLPQMFKEHHLNYNNLEGVLNLVRDIAKLSGKFYTVFDYCKKEFIYFSENSDLFNFHTIPEQKGYEFLINNSDKEDIFLMLQFQQRAYEYLMRKKVAERTNFIFSTAVRVHGKGGGTDVIYKIKPQLLDGEGNIWLTIATLEKTNSYILPQARNIETGELQFFKPFNIVESESYYESLSKQELKILHFMANEQPPTDICNVLNIKMPTFKRHRAEIYRKLGVGSKVQAINRAYFYGVI